MKSVLIFLFIWVAPIVKAQTNEQPKDTIENLVTMAEFPGGQTALNEYLAKNIHYPKKEKKEGRVLVEFVISVEGKITEVKIKKGLCETLDAEALRVVENMPDWIPASNRGKPVNQRYVLPINFAGSRP